MNRLYAMLLGFLISMTAAPSFGAPLKVFVTEFNATGAANRDEMKGMLQTLLSARINGDNIASVGSAAEADAMVSGNYIAIGRIFSVDAIARSTSGKTLARAFVQGESQDELIPAVGKLAEKLAAELAKLPAGAVTRQQIKPTSSGIIASTPAVKSNIVKSGSSEFIKSGDGSSDGASGWQSRRLNGAVTLIADGLTLSDGSRELFLAEESRFSYYRQGEEMKLIATAELGSSDKIISIDTIIGDAGAMDVYLTVIRNGDLSSEVWQVKGDKLSRVAEKLPFYFRAVALAGGAKRLYAQSMGRDTVDYYGEVSEANRSGAKITLTNSLRLPKTANIYNFNQFRDRDGRVMTTIMDEYNYLLVYDQELNEIWRSNDKFGGSELYFQREDIENIRTRGDKYRWIFLNQRIQVTASGEILIGRNEGFFVLGNSRSYKKGAVHSMFWNGSSLEEKWRTKDTQNYMPDYLYDSTRNELLLLQLVQRSGFTTKAASVLQIKRVE